MPAWGRFMLLFYVALFAFVMPFICWGAWAEPGHAHGGPHFVFAAPPQRGESLADLVWSLQSYCGSPRTDWTTTRAGQKASNGDVPVTGQSLPDTTLVFTIFLIIFGGWLLLQCHRRQVERAAIACHAKSYVHLVPTPPPRFVCT